VNRSKFIFDERQEDSENKTSASAAEEHQNVGIAKLPED
jgi:predicted metal-dependent HD superfamily phosphohydrolase